MGKCWMLEKKNDNSEFTFETLKHMNLTEYPSNPMEPIREVWEKWKTHYSNNKIVHAHEHYLWQAIQKSIAIQEGREP